MEETDASMRTRMGRGQLPAFSLGTVTWRPFRKWQAAPELTYAGPYKPSRKRAWTLSAPLPTHMRFMTQP